VERKIRHLKYAFSKSWFIPTAFLLCLFPTSCGSKSTIDHPVFDGLSEICLPLMSNHSNDENKTIEKLAKKAGFRKGSIHFYTHKFSDSMYSIGDKKYGAQIENWNHGSRILCGSSVRSMAEKYPTVPEFTKWLKKESSDWELISNQSKGAPKRTKAVYCNKKNPQYEQGLVYFVRELKAPAPPILSQATVTLIVEDVQKQKCSGWGWNETWQTPTEK